MTTAPHYYRLETYKENLRRADEVLESLLANIETIKARVSASILSWRDLDVFAACDHLARILLQEAHAAVLATKNEIERGTKVADSNDIGQMKTLLHYIAMCETQNKDAERILARKPVAPEHQK